MIEDELINRIVNTSMWRLSPSFKTRTFYLLSNIKGYYSGRYRIKIKKLKRKVEGKIYKVAVYWTPYNPNYKVLEGRINTYEEFVELLSVVNKDLLDEERILDGVK